MDFDDGDYHTWVTLDEDNWERFRNEKIDIVRRLINFLMKLRVLNDDKHEHLYYKANEFVDRHWKA